MSTQVDMYAPLLREMNQAAILCDLSGRVEWANVAAGDLLDVPSHDMEGRDIEDLLGGAGALVSDGVYRHALATPMNGRAWLQRTVSLVPVDVGRPNLSLHLLTDISEFDARRPTRAAVSLGLEESRLDPDTGVLKRQAIIQELTAEISRSRRYANPLGAIMVRFTDCATLEPPEVESQSTRELVCQCINAGLRWVDSVGALDDGTLMVVLPETDEAAIERVAVKLESLLHAIDLPASGTDLESKVTFIAWGKELDADGVIGKLLSKSTCAAA